MVLAKNLARSIRRGHPWVYRDALRPTTPLADGAAVVVVTPDRRPLARGFWDRQSPIAVRLLGDETVGDIGALIEPRVEAALARRLAVGAIDRAQTDAFRWLHGEADGLPGVHADLYGAAVALRFDGGGARAFYQRLPAILEAVAGRHDLRLDAVIERRRGPRGGAGAGVGVAVPEPAEAAVALRGQVPPGEIEVRENGLRFGVDLGHGQKGGLFLDQRDNRALVRTLAAGRRVLNLFGYTGGFSVYAAAGGAVATDTVDVGKQAIAAARRNFERNSLDTSQAGFHAQDAFEFLERAARDGQRWDLVISDPPSFAPNHAALARALAAYRRLHRLCAAVVAPGGTLCAASCSSHVDRAAFLETVAAGARAAGRTWMLQSWHGAAIDHPVLSAFPEGDYLKFAVGQL